MTELNLLTDLRYHPFEGGAEELGRQVFRGEAGTDGLLHIAFIYSDDFSFKIVSCGFRLPYTEEEKRILESGEALPLKADETVILPAGRYLFSQQAPFDSMDDLRRSLLPWCGLSKHCYARLFKENALHEVLQLFVPLQLPCR